MVDAPTYRAEPDPDFADRLEQVLLQRLTAPAGSRTRREVAQSDEPVRTDTEPDGQASEMIVLDGEDRTASHEPMTRRLRLPDWRLLVAAAAAVVAVVGTLLVAAADDDTDRLDTVTSNPASAAQIGAFCDAIDDMGLTVSIGEGYEGIDDALVAAEEIAPEEISAEVTIMAAESRAQFAAGPPPDGTPPTLPADDFFTAAAAVGDYMADNCGYQVIDVTATNYAFEGIPAIVGAGKTLIRITNDGTEYHEAVLQRVRQSETRSIEEILAIPQGSGDLLDYLGNAFAPPGLGNWTVVDLSAGRYAFLCFVPTGATSEEALRSGQADDTAQPHTMQGMFAEMEVP